MSDLGDRDLCQHESHRPQTDGDDILTLSNIKSHANKSSAELKLLSLLQYAIVTNNNSQ
jgi:hypothetical protein